MSKLRRCSTASKSKNYPTPSPNPTNEELARELAKQRILTSKLIAEKTQIIKENRELTDSNIHLKHQLRQVVERQRILTETIAKLTSMKQLDPLLDISLSSCNESFDSGLHSNTSLSSVNNTSAADSCVSTTDSCVNTSFNFVISNKNNVIDDDATPVPYQTTLARRDDATPQPFNTTLASDFVSPPHLASSPNEAFVTPICPARRAESDFVTPSQPSDAIVRSARSSRRKATSYKEPNLRDKMRRPT